MCRVVCVEPQKSDMTGTNDGKCMRRAPMAVDLKNGSVVRARERAAGIVHSSLCVCVS